MSKNEKEIPMPCPFCHIRPTVVIEWDVDGTMYGNLGCEREGGPICPCKVHMPFGDGEAFEKTHEEAISIWNQRLSEYLDRESLKTFVSEEAKKFAKEHGETQAKFLKETIEEAQKIVSFASAGTSTAEPRHYSMAELRS